MRQILLAIVLILVPVGIFSGAEFYLSRQVSAAQGLGDLTALKTIIADVQAKAAAGDLAGAKTRVTDFESAWDEAEAGMRPLNPDAWTKVDGAADAALHALRSGTVDPAKVTATLAALMALLDNPLAAN